MGHFAWSAENEVFIAQIDAEHRNLLQVAAELERAVEAPVPPQERRDRLGALAARMEEHFSHEEWLMESVSYPLFGWHRQQHDTARRRLKLFRPLVEADDANASEAFFEFLSGWFEGHTGVTDRMIAAFVRNYERSHATSAFERWGAAGPPGSARRQAPAQELGPFPKTVRFCKTCGRQTTHELKPDGLACRDCAARVVGAELDRD